MSGAYCQFCDRRCFVYRVLPDRSWSGHMATCAAGAAHDHVQLDHDHTTAINPHDQLARLSDVAPVHDTPTAIEVVAEVLRELACYDPVDDTLRRWVPRDENDPELIEVWVPATSLARELLAMACLETGLDLVDDTLRVARATASATSGPVDFGSDRS